MFWKKSKIYRADGQLQLHEIKWFRLKAGVSFVGSTALLVLALLVVLSGFTATASVYLTGHSGAKSVWEDTAP